MPKLWLTYAWTDNNDRDVDFVAQELERQGLQVSFDRAHLVAGQRLWDQIDRAISDPTISDGWAIFVTENSLKSEPCQEELAIALDRALRKRGGNYPLIGIFPTDVDRSLVPSAIATRLWVSLNDPTWGEQVAGSLTGTSRSKPDQVAPFAAKRYPGHNGSTWIELRPRAGTWFPAFAAVAMSEKHKLRSARPGASGRLPGGGFAMVSSSSADLDGIPVWVLKIDQAASNQVSLFVDLNGLPKSLYFGNENGPIYIIDPASIPL